MQKYLNPHPHLPKPGALHCPSFHTQSYQLTLPTNHNHEVHPRFPRPRGIRHRCSRCCPSCCSRRGPRNSSKIRKLRCIQGSCHPCCWIRHVQDVRATKGRIRVLWNVSEGVGLC
ncbi:hypothetical protein HBI12_052840 [Parastagonospora nodorum]|nr:hypothetical protein HBI12_052840 [Parastagonospora nodorum]